MDKKKTGILIKEARISKNYTQSELGDLLGVTNKAVSRWENGESFPDIGILENLSGILGIKIQDIVVGEISADETCGNRENIIAEVIRMAKLQEKSNKKKVLCYIGGICIMLYSLFLALAGMESGFAFESYAQGGAFYIISLAAILGVVLLSVFWSVNRQQYTNPVKNRISKVVLRIAVGTYLYEILVIGIIVMMSANGLLSVMGNRFFNTQSIGSFFNIQLLVAFFVNFAMMIMESVRIAKENTDVHRGIFVSMSAMYIAMLYSDMFHRMCTAQQVLQMYLFRTIAVLAVMGCALLVFYFLQRRRRSVAKRFC